MSNSPIIIRNTNYYLIKRHRKSKKSSIYFGMYKTCKIYILENIHILENILVYESIIKSIPNMTEVMLSK